MKKETEETDKTIVQYEGTDLWTIDLQDEGTIKILPGQEIELDASNKKHMHVILSIIKETNQGSNELEYIETTGEGKKVKYRERFKIIEQGKIPDELLKLRYGLNKLYTPEQKEMITSICPEYFNNPKKNR